MVLGALFCVPGSSGEMYVSVLLLLRLTGRKRRPGPTSTRWMVALAKRTVALGDMGRWMGDAGGEPDGEEGGMVPKAGQEEGWPGLEGSPVSGLTNCLAGRCPSGLETRRMDLGMGMGMGELADLRICVLVYWLVYV